MALEKKNKKGKRTDPMSFRFTRDAFRKLRALSSHLNMDQVEILEALIEKEFEVQKRKEPKALQDLIKEQFAEFPDED